MACKEHLYEPNFLHLAVCQLHANEVLHDLTNRFVLETIKNILNRHFYVLRSDSGLKNTKFAMRKIAHI